MQSILLNAKKGHRSSGPLVRPSPRSIARAARANKHSTPPEGGEHACATENGRPPSRQRGCGVGAEAAARPADARHRRHPRSEGTDSEAAAAAREADPPRRQHTRPDSALGKAEAAAAAAAPSEALVGSPLGANSRPGSQGGVNPKPRGSSTEGVWLQPTLTPLGVPRAKRRLLITEPSSPTAAVVGERNGSSGDGGEGGGAFRLPRHEDNEWRQRLACRASSGTTIEDRAATYADRAVTVPPHAKSLAKLRRALAQRNARRARGEDPIEPEKLTSVKAVALKLGASTVGTAFSPNKVHELQWSKYGSQYRMNAEEQRKKKLDEANVCPPAAHRIYLHASAPPHPPPPPPPPPRATCRS